MTILQPQLTLTAAASAPKTPLAERREEVKDVIYTGKEPFDKFDRQEPDRGSAGTA